MDFRHETVEDLARRVQRREVSARELVEVALGRIDELNPTLGAFVAVDEESARAQANEVDERIARGEDPGPLAGVPIGVKDTEDVIGYRTTFGSRLFADGPEAGADSALVDRLRQAGCVIVGKTNTPELAWKADTDNRLFGRTANPWSLERSAGGSSGGSSGGGGMADGHRFRRWRLAAHPGALCGLSTAQALARPGAGRSLPPGWADLSSKGVLTRTIRDTAVALDSVIGPDPTDLRALPMPEQSWTDAMANVHAPRRVVWSATLGYAVVDPEIRAVCERAVQVLEANGTEVVHVDDVFGEDPGVDWLTLAMAANLRTLHGCRSHRCAGPTSIRPSPSWSLGAGHATVSSAVEVMDRAHELNLRLVEVFHTAPLLLTPTVAGQTPVGDANGTVHGVEDASWVRFTYPFNLTRSPAGSVCAGFTADGMPVGLQVVGPQHADVVVLRALAHLERILAVDTVCPIA
jgi:aspartyl-tRNA(Asn)/glutamyl-tRNA(Gln) amidotransferase subunit A